MRFVKIVSTQNEVDYINLDTIVNIKLKNGVVVIWLMTGQTFTLSGAMAAGIAEWAESHMPKDAIVVNADSSNSQFPSRL